MAEPGYIRSKSPSTVHTEFASRMAKGNHPDAVYRQLIAEIADHHGKGAITNRDAHRAANEAFGRLLMARKKRGGPDGSGINPDPSYAPDMANPQSTVSGPQN